MKYLKQFGIICAVALFGDVVKEVTGLPIPGNIIGMLTLFVLLLTGVIKLSAVEDTAEYLMGIMSVMFIPLGAGIITNYQYIQNDLLSIVLVLVITTVFTFSVTGLIVENLSRKKDASKEETIHE